MKKVFVFVALIALVSVAFTGCKKSTDEPTYTKSQLIGKWKQTSPASDAGKTDYISFTETKISNIVVPTGGSESSMSYDYTFDGKAIKYNFIVDVILTINELSSTKLVVTATYTGIPGSQQYTYTK